MSETAKEGTAPEAKLTPQVRHVLITLITGGMASILDSTMVTLAISTLARHLHSDPGTMQWVTTAYLLAMAVALPVTGWLESRLGGKRAWVMALLIFVIGSVLCATAWNDISLIGFRVLQGFGAGLAMPLIMTLMVRAANGHVTPRLMAATSLPIAFGTILGPVIGGVILHWLTWPWMFLVNVPIIAVGLVLAWFYLPTDHRDRSEKRTHLDVIGLVLLMPALVGILLGLSQLSEDGGICHTDVLVPLIAGIVLLAAYVAWGLHKGEHEPVVNIRLLRLRSLGTAAATLFTAGAAMYAAMFLLPLYYQQLRGESVLNAGLLLIPQGVGTLLIRIVVGRLCDRFGVRVVTIASFLLAAVATIPFAFAGPQTNIWWLGIVLLIRGLGIGAVLVPPMSVAYQDIPITHTQHATMNINIIQQVGSSFGTAIVAVVLQALLAHGLAHAYHTAFGWAILITIVALIPAIGLPDKKKPV